MAQFPAYTSPPSLNLVSIIGPQYCAPNPVDLAIVKKVKMIMNHKKFVARDINDNILFTSKGLYDTIGFPHVLFDAAGKPLVTLRKKIITAHERWQVFRGESTDLNDLIFTAKKSSMFQLKTKLDVFLANNKEEDVCDFKVKASWFSKSCVVYAGESDTIVAEMHKKTTFLSKLFGVYGNAKFVVTMYPNIDHAFISALIIILDAMDQKL